MISQPPVPSSLPAYEMRRLVDFFNHGILPFVGRRKELEQVRAFWQSTPGSHGLRTALLLGEAGVGKSRLLEELIPGVVADGGVVLHAKLFPGSSSSLVPLLTRALRFSGPGRSLLKKEPEETLDSVIGSIQRIARLRPTLLVIEDAHLLGDDSMGECAMLFEALSGETISILALARPVELKARGVLERYLVEEVELRGLCMDDFSLIWFQIFGSLPDTEIASAFMKVSLGNVLALRSALRGALKSELLRRTGNGGWGTLLTPQQFEEALKRNVELLSEGMAVHLSQEEKHAAEKLAALGEVFSREAATMMIDDAIRTIERLAFKGIIARATTSITPLPGPGSNSPLLVFTHTLLHKHLVEGGSADTDRLIAVVASNAPLYSILPFQLVGGSQTISAAQADHLFGFVDRAIEAALLLERTSDCDMGRDLLRASQRAFAAGAGRWSPEDEQYMEAKVLALELRIMLRGGEVPEHYRQLVDEFLAVTDTISSEPVAELRIVALRHLVLRRKIERVGMDDIWQEVDSLLEKYPATLFSKGYIYFLQSVASGIAGVSDSAPVQIVEKRLAQILSSDGLTEEARRLALREVAPHFLWIFGTPAELENRMKLLKQIEEVSDRNDTAFQLRKIAFFEGQGWSDQAIGMIDEMLPRLRERGLSRHIVPCQLIRLYALAGLGADLEKLEQDLQKIVADSPASIAARVAERGAIRLAATGLLRGDSAWSARLVHRFAGEGKLDPELRLAFAVIEGRVQQELDALVVDKSDEDDMVEHLASLFHPEHHLRAAVVEKLDEVLRMPVLSRGSVVRLHLIIDILDAAGAIPENRSILRPIDPSVRDAGVISLEWLSVRSLHAYMAPLLAKCSRYLDEREISSWQKRIEALSSDRKESKGSESDEKMTISMLGVIEATRRGEEPIRLRGARLRTVLGLLVADQMFDRPLSYREFCRLAAGGEDDPERARKMVSMALLRLREAIGAEAIHSVDGETPRLNLEHLRVDLLDADQKLREAVEHLRTGHLLPAFHLLTEALDLISGEVPFPTLYDELFEALRGDFDYRVREAIIEMGRGLLAEEDPAHAEQVLRRGFDAMPEDEEISDLLCKALEAQGRRADAGRVRLQVVELVVSS